MKRRGFTLIELLVVIAIIAILAAILFPVFAQAKAAAKKTQALSNAKQTTLGVIMYSNDTDDVFPMGSGFCWFYPTDGGWSWDTQPYIKNEPILKDPSDSLGKALWQSWFDPNFTVTVSFASNGYIGWDNTLQKNRHFGVIGMAQGSDMNGQFFRCNSGPLTWGWFENSIVPAGTVTKPAESIMFASHYGGNNQWGGGGDMVSNNTGWDFSGPSAIPDGRRDGSPYTVTIGGVTTTVNKDNRFGAIQGIYANNGIFTFCDGHAKAMNPAATNPNNDTQPDKNLWNAKR